MQKADCPGQFRRSLSSRSLPSPNSVIDNSNELAEKLLRCWVLIKVLPLLPPYNSNFSITSTCVHASPAPWSHNYNMRTTLMVRESWDRNYSSFCLVSGYFLSFLLLTKDVLYCLVNERWRLNFTTFQYLISYFEDKEKRIPIPFKSANFNSGHANFPFVPWKTLIFARVPILAQHFFCLVKK